jgi:dephospho-CoA kinase
VKRPFTVALTGGIGSGKSAAADIFGRLGAAVIDTDAIAHDLTGPGGAAMPDIVEAFGTACAASDGSLDRGAMRTRVFADASARHRLEAILHPRIHAEVLHRLAGTAAPYAVVVVPLLVETQNYDSITDRVLVVDCAESTQLSRVMQRNGYSEEMVRRILASQAGRRDRLAKADDVLDNDAEVERLAEQVTHLHRDYLYLAGQKAGCGDAHCVRRSGVAQ